MFLDVRTLSIVTVAVYVLVALAMVLLAYGNRENRGLRGLAVGASVVTVGLVLLGLRAVGIPDWASVVLGNGLTALGLAQMTAGLRRYFGRPAGWPGLLVPVVLDFAAMIWFSQVVDAIAWRIFSASMAYAWFGALVAAEFLRPAADETWRGPRLMVGLAQLIHVGVSLWRGIAAVAGAAPPELFAPYWINAVAFLDAIVTYLAFAIGMILVEGQRLQARLATLAASDPLTGLANRRGFVDRVSAMPAGQGAVLLLVDFDHFKSVNDRYGHAAGDAVLIEAGRRFLAARRPGDCIGRLGGEEFAWFMPGTTIEAARGLAEALRADFAARPIAIGEGEVDLRISVGVAAMPSDGADWPEIYRVADERLYRAKDQGRDRVVAFAD